MYLSISKGNQPFAPESFGTILEPGKSSECRIFTSHPESFGTTLEAGKSSERTIHFTTKDICIVPRLANLALKTCMVKGNQRGTPTCSSSNVGLAFLRITTWVKLFNMFVAFPSTILNSQGW